MAWLHYMLFHQCISYNKKKVLLYVFAIKHYFNQHHICFDSRATHLVCSVKIFWSTLNFSLSLSLQTMILVDNFDYQSQWQTGNKRQKICNCPCLKQWPVLMKLIWSLRTKHSGNLFFLDRGFLRHNPTRQEKGRYKVTLVFVLI